jgi:hypothetical protein
MKKKCISTATVAVLSLTAASAASAPTSPAERLVRDASIAATSNNLDLALQKLLEASALLPSNGPILQKIAEIYVKKGEPCEAQHGFTAAARIANERGRNDIEEQLVARARESGRACVAEIAINVASPCSDDVTRISLTSSDGAPLPAESSAQECSHTFTMPATSFSKSRPGTYQVVIKQPGKVAEMREVKLPGKTRVSIGVGPLRAVEPGVNSSGSTGGVLHPVELGPSSILFGVGVGSVVLATALGASAILLGAIEQAKAKGGDISAAVPILGASAVTVGGTGLVLVFSNLPRGPVDPPRGVRETAFTFGLGARF